MRSWFFVLTIAVVTGMACRGTTPPPAIAPTLDVPVFMAEGQQTLTLTGSNLNPQAITIGQQIVRVLSATANSVQLAIDSPLLVGDYHVNLTNKDGGQFNRDAAITVVALGGEDVVLGGSFAAIRPNTSQSTLENVVQSAGFTVEGFQAPIVPSSTSVCGQSIAQFQDQQGRSSAAALNALRQALAKLGEGVVWDVNARALFDEPSVEGSIPSAAPIHQNTQGQNIQNISVAVLDSGVSDHPEFNSAGGNNIINLQDARNFTIEKNIADSRSLLLDVSDLFTEKTPYGEVVSTQRTGHGTAVAALIAAPAGNFDGTFGQMVGVAPGAGITPIKVCTKDGKCDAVDVTLGICHAVALKKSGRPIEVMNLSIAGKNPANMVYQALQEAAAVNISIVASSGNDGRKPNTPSQFPAYYAVDAPGQHRAITGMIAVGAFGNSTVSDFSSRGPWVTVVAPGENVLSTTITDQGPSYRLFSGTSFAAPQVAGLVTIFRATNPHWSLSQLKQKVIRQAKPVPGCSREACGAGLIAGF
jgi:subtilisin